jgi:hypothetical protein
METRQNYIFIQNSSAQNALNEVCWHPISGKYQFATRRLAPTIFSSAL